MVFRIFHFSTQGFPKVQDCTAETAEGAEFFSFYSAFSALSAVKREDRYQVPTFGKPYFSTPSALTELASKAIINPRID